MGLKIEPVSADVLEAEFGTSSSGNDKETVTYIRGLAIGEGFTVQAEGDETPRKVKRRVNACAKEAFRELEWHDRAAGGFLARVKAIDSEAQKKWQDEQDAKAKPKEQPAEQAGAQTNGRQASREKAGAAA